MAKAANLRARTLDTAKACVTKDRQATHGKPENTFAAIAAIWSAQLSAVRGEEVTITAEEVAALLAGLKLARITQNPQHLDNWVDLAGYAACGAELAGAK